MAAKWEMGGLVRHAGAVLRPVVTASNEREETVRRPGVP